MVTKKLFLMLTGLMGACSLASAQDSMSLAETQLCPNLGESSQAKIRPFLEKEKNDSRLGFNAKTRYSQAQSKEKLKNESKNQYAIAKTYFELGRPFCGWPWINFSGNSLAGVKNNDPEMAKISALRNLMGQTLEGAIQSKASTRLYVKYGGSLRFIKLLYDKPDFLSEGAASLQIDFSEVDDTTSVNDTIATVQLVPLPAENSSSQLAFKAQNCDLMVSVTPLVLTIEANDALGCGITLKHELSGVYYATEMHK